MDDSERLEGTPVKKDALSFSGVEGVVLVVVAEKLFQTIPVSVYVITTTSTGR